MNIKTKLQNDIIKKINDGVKNGVTARDILLSFTQLDKINQIFTTRQKQDYNNFLTNCIDYDFNEKDDIIIKLNSKHKDLLKDLLNKFIDFEKFSNSEIKKVLVLTFTCFFDLKFVTKDKTEKLKSFETAKRNITINQFVIKFLQCYCYINDLQIISLENDCFIISKSDFIEIKKQAYNEYNDNLKKLLNK